MVTIDPDDILTTDTFTIIGFVLAIISLIISIATVYQLKRKTEFKKTYFYFSMILIVSGSLITSLLYFSQVICDSRSLKENSCKNWMYYGLNLLLAHMTYLLFFVLLLASTFKYSILRTINQWKINYQPLIIAVGLVLYLATMATKVATLWYNVPSLLFSLVGLLTIYSATVDVTFLVLLLKQLRQTRMVCVSIPKPIEKAYISTRNALLVFLLIFPVIIILVVLSFWVSNKNKELYDNCFITFKYTAHALAVYYFLLDVISMVLIKKLTDVESGSSSYFGLDSTYLGSELSATKSLQK
eukprot:NODE_158_length_16653_cov_0.456929.p6 type:complete len:299 gc:universal NODE_158_length_16653_cov_0.456929:6733-5837(-)